MIDLKSMVTTSRRFVMVIGNGGAALSYVTRSKVEKSWFISDFSDESLDIFAAATHEHRRVPLTILIDMLEQSYRRETIPPVNMLDRPKVLNRRLGIAFPSYDIKAALSLDEVVGQRGDLAYLFVALPTSPEIETWISFIHGLDNPISSLGLLPLESSSLAAALGKAQADEQNPPADWTLLISRERTGGIRQIVVRRGKLAITRLTPPPPGKISPADLAMAISQEMTSTLTYLTRLGYTAGDRLDMIVIGPEEMRQTLEAQQTPGRRTTLFTPSEAARRLNLADFDDSPDAYGDLLHIAWTAAKRKPALEMAGHVLGQRRVQLVAARKWVTGGLAAAAVVLGVFSATLTLDMLDIRQAIDDAQNTQTRLERLVEDLTMRIETYPDRPKLMNSVLAHHDKLTLQSTVPVPVLAGISDSLGPSIRLKNLLWVAEDVRSAKKSRSQSAAVQGKVKKPGFAVDLAVDLSAFGDADRAIAETNALAERLRERFAASEVVIVRPPLDILPTQTLIGFDSEDASEQDAAALSADITITGNPE